MKTRLISLFILAGILTAFTVYDDKGRIVKEEEFQKQIDTIGLKFTMPDGYEETYVKENKDLHYYFAIKGKNADFEVRYSIRTLKPVIAEYKKCQEDPNCVSVKPNAIYKSMAMANLLNMTAGQRMDVGTFPPQAVKSEFNADAGGSAFFEFNCEFGKGYKYGQMVYLHKDDVADVMITYMSNNQTTHPDLMEKVFHALTFK
jgi:hypothetical protein